MKRTNFRFLIHVLLVISFFTNQLVVSSSVNLPDWVVIGSFVQYTQQFSTGELHELFWNVTHVNTSMVGITIRSHGIQQNQTSGELIIVPGGGHILIDRNTWIILQVTFGNITRDYGDPIDEKVSFWIPVSVNEKTPIDTKYDNHIIPTSKALNLSHLSTCRDCWVTNNIYSETASMERWYDKQTGIVLRIKTEITFGSSKSSVLETINTTNIETLLSDSCSQSSFITSSNTYFGIESLLLLFSCALLLRGRCKKQD
ncbi:MAG: hypothetical protein ACFFC6_03525 [Promethearchaeota archaeon]